jgi:transposase
VIDGPPSHKTNLVKDYVQSTEGRLTLHFLPGYAPELNPDELVWHMKRTGVARTPLRKGERCRRRSRRSWPVSRLRPGSSGHSSERRVSPILPTDE